jgi:hypothetical protein
MSVKKLKSYNKKGFLLPNSILSMAAYHAKIHEHPRNEYQFRLSDCNNTIKLWGKLESLEDAKESIKKLKALSDAANKLAEEISNQFLNKESKI